MMKILIVSHVFPPFNVIGAVRVGHVARLLLEHGHEVRILTAAPHDLQRDLDLGIPPDVIFATRWLDSMKWLMRLRSSCAGKAQARVGISPTAGSGTSTLVKWVKALLHLPDYAAAWIPFALSAGRALTREWRPDIIYSSAPPFSGHIVASRLAKLLGVPWVAEFRDLFAGNPYTDLPAWRQHLDRLIEERILRHCTGLVTVSAPLAEDLTVRYKRPVHVMLTGCDPAEPPPPGDPDGRLRILYTGTVYPGRRDPSAVFAAARLSGLGPDEIELSFCGQDLRVVHPLALAEGVSHLVTELPLQPHAQTLRLQSEADVLLQLLWNDPREKGIMTGKLFEYIAAKRPILVVGYEDAASARLVAERGLGLVTNDPQAIACQMREWVTEKRRLGRPAEPPAEARRGLDRQEQVAALERFLETMTASWAG